MNNYDAPSQNFPINQNPARSSREFMKYPGLMSGYPSTSGAAGTLIACRRRQILFIRVICKAGKLG
jgi:hypothetical protein